MYAAIWKYNFPRHIQIHHPTLWDNNLGRIVQNPVHKGLWEDMAVPQTEIDAMVSWAEARAEKRPASHLEENSKRGRAVPILTNP